MNAKTLTIGIAIVLLAVLAYYMGTMQPQSVIRAQDESPVMTGGENEAGVYAAVDPAMTGTWESKEDAKFTREFRADGTVVDRYQGDASATATGTFVTIDPSVVEVPGIPSANLGGLTVIRIEWAGDPAPMFFSIQTMTESELHMTNLSGRGNILMFTKI